jgi:sec-independent protein translocase protein TatB
MFDIGWSELVVIGVVALIAIGPKELPGVLRMTGQWIGKVRRMAAEFQGQFQEALREAEMEDLKKQVNEISDSARDFTRFDPMESVKSEFDSSFEAIRVDEPESGAPGSASATPQEAGQAAASDTASGAGGEPVATSEPVQPAAEPAMPESVADAEVASEPSPKTAAGGHST